jgi:hypothetical protein
MVEDDGDIIKGVGHVTINSAYLEESVNKLLVQLSIIEKFDDKKRKLPVSAKIKRAQKILGSLDDPLATEISDTLDQCSDHFEWRNGIIHGLIKSPDYHENNLESLRPNEPDRKLGSEEIYMLANSLENLRIALNSPMLFRLKTLLRKLGYDT